MPITKSAKRAIRQNLRRKIQNNQKKRKIKNLLKQTEGLISQKNLGEAKKFLPKVYKSLDKAVKIGLIKKNTAARRKSRIAKSIRGEGYEPESI